jgi:ribosomal protein S18 acetylase RimI-like enzyme
MPRRYRSGSSRPVQARSQQRKSASFSQKSYNLVFLAFVDEAPAGYAYAEVVRRPETSLTYPYETLHVHHISVIAEFRRRGVGGALLSVVRASGLRLGITLLTLDVWSFNEDARAFFRRHGFCNTSSGCGANRLAHVAISLSDSQNQSPRAQSTLAYREKE